MCNLVGKKELFAEDKRYVYLKDKKRIFGLKSGCILRGLKRCAREEKNRTFSSDKRVIWRIKKNYLRRITEVYI